MFNEIDYEQLDKLFESNKENVYFFSAESLETIDVLECEHLFFQNLLNKNCVKKSKDAQIYFSHILNDIDMCVEINILMS